MNVEKLHVIARALLADLKETNVEKNLEAIGTSLQNQINQPSQPQFQSQVAETFKTLVSNLEKSQSNNFVQTWKQVIGELGAQNLFGRPLADRIKEIFARNQITPAVAMQEIRSIVGEVHSFRESLDWLLNAFERMKIGSEQMKPGECEIGILIPRENVGNQFDKFAEELEEFDSILGSFSELATGKRPGFQVKSVSTTDFTVFLNSDPLTLATIAVAVERITAFYKNLLEIPKLSSELKGQGVGDKQRAGIEEYANGVMENGIEGLRNDLFKTYYKQKDPGRENELRTAIGFALRKIANRIDRGVNIEIRALPPVAPAKPEGERAQSDEEAIAHFSAIEEAASKIEFLRGPGSPILSLPEGTSGKSEKK